MSLEFYHPHKERLAVQQISKRVSEGGGDWQGWSASDILKPERHRYHFNQNNLLSHFGFGRRYPHEKLYEPLNEFEIFMKFKELLREFDPFIVIDNFVDDTFSDNGWLLATLNSASKRGLKPRRGLGYYNRYDLESGHRVAEKIALLQVTCPKSGIYAQLVDCCETNASGLKVKAMKVLMVRNPNRVNPFAMRRFLKTLKAILIDDQSYGIAWGNAAVIDQEDHPHNAQNDKRFETYETKLIYLAKDTSMELDVSNLTHYWCCVGFELMLSPDYEQHFAVAMVSPKMKAQLLAKDALVWGQFFK